MGIKINQYAIDRTVFGDDDYYDIDYWTGSSYETAKIKGSVIKAAILAAVVSENLFNTNNLTLSANREHYLTDKEFKFDINDSSNNIIGNSRFSSAGIIGYLNDTSTNVANSYNINSSDMIFIADGPSNYTSLVISPGSISLSEGGTDVLIDGINAQLTAGNGTLQLGSVGTSNTWYTDNSTNKYGILLIGFGETSETNGTGANYTTLVDTSLVPKKYVDDEIANISTSSIYTANDSLTGNRTVDLLTYTLTFDGTGGSSAPPIHVNCKEVYTGDPVYFKVNNNGGITLRGADGTSGAIKVISGYPSSTTEIFKVDRFGGGFWYGSSIALRQSTTGSGISLVSGNSLQIHDVNNNLRHDIGTNTGSGNQHCKFYVNGYTYSGKFIIGSSTPVETENISLQGKTVIKGTDTLSTSTALAIYDGNSTPNKLWDFTNDGNLSGESGARITNAILNPNVQEIASSTTFTINADEETMGVLTSMSAGTTIANPTGTPVQGQKLIFRFTDDGTARAITWNAIFRAIGVTLPTTTTATKLLYVGCVYNSTDTKWDVIAVKEEA